MSLIRLYGAMLSKDPPSDKSWIAFPFLSTITTCLNDPELSPDILVTSLFVLLSGDVLFIYFFKLLGGCNYRFGSDWNHPFGIETHFFFERLTKRYWRVDFVGQLSPQTICSACFSIYTGAGWYHIGGWMLGCSAYHKLYREKQMKKF